MLRYFTIFIIILSLTLPVVADTEQQSCASWFFVFRTGYSDSSCATSVVKSDAAFQDFEHGRMYWYGATAGYPQNLIYVMFEDGSWLSYVDAWDSSQPEGDLQPPSGRIAPIRGFGKVWQENSNVRNSLGWATTPEYGYTGTRQSSSGSSMFYLDNGNWEVVRLNQSDHRWTYVGYVTGGTSPSGSTASGQTTSSVSCANTPRPSWVNSSDIEEVKAVFNDAVNGVIDESTARAILNSLDEDPGKKTLKWILRNACIIPNGQGGYITYNEWVVTFMQQLPPGARDIPFVSEVEEEIERDPTGFTVDLLFLLVVGPGSDTFIPNTSDILNLMEQADVIDVESFGFDIDSLSSATDDLFESTTGESGNTGTTGGTTGSSSTSSQSTTSSCQGYLTPRLQIGGQGRILPGEPNALNSLPKRPSRNPDSEMLGLIPGGGVFTVLDGPVCGDGNIVWWKVDYQGLIGWTGEGQNSTYWAEPY